MAIKLHFRRGAVVRFVLACDTNYYAAGRVIHVNKDEVVFVPQKYVAEHEYDRATGTSMIDKEISVDENKKIHLDRNQIAIWYYEPVPGDGNTIFYNVLQPSEVNRGTTDLNKYDIDGICRGTGEYFE